MTDQNSSYPQQPHNPEPHIDLNKNGDHQQQSEQPGYGQPSPYAAPPQYGQPVNNPYSNPHQPQYGQQQPASPHSYGAAPRGDYQAPNQAPWATTGQAPQEPQNAAQQPGPYSNPYANQNNNGYNQNQPGFFQRHNLLVMLSVPLFFFMPLIALVLSIIGLNQINKNTATHGTNDKTVAIVIIVLSAGYMLLAMVIGFFSAIFGAFNY